MTVINFVGKKKRKSSHEDKCIEKKVRKKTQLRIEMKLFYAV